MPDKKSRVGSEFNSPKESPGFLLWRVGNEWQRGIRDTLRPFGLTHAQFVLLAGMVWLEDRGCEVTQTLLARQTATDKMVVSDVIGSLAAKKLIVRKRGTKDRRSFELQATSMGVQMLTKAMKAVEDSNRLFFARSSFPRSKIVEMLSSLSSLDFRG
jgi:DNA-binding MarR family transcriptional regulator